MSSDKKINTTISFCVTEKAAAAINAEAARLRRSRSWVCAEALAGRLQLSRKALKGLN